MSTLLDLVDACDFADLFVGELDWSSPTQKPLTITIDDESYTLTQAADYKGLRIWHCPELPPRGVQRQIDHEVAKNSQERLIIFTNDTHQDWRWPLRAQTGAASPRLLVHPHTTGEPNQQLERRLNAIRIGLDDRPSLPDLLARMRGAFDVETETASVEAARLMGTLYTHLDTAGFEEEYATLLLARLLFLLFGDDADLNGWSKNQFAQWVELDTTDDNLHIELAELFRVLNTDINQRGGELSPRLAAFRYVNGGIFADDFTIPALPSGFRRDLISAGVFDWSVISPAIFGSMFQTVKSKEARRSFGEHYTTEANIMKLIGPLFLNELHEAYEKAVKADSPKQLNDLRERIGQMQFMDPACGCGNFLVVTYRELRRLEHRILQTLRDRKNNTQHEWFTAADLVVTLDNFYGIEIEQWPAQIARTAMILVDHQMNLELQATLGVAVDRLPLTATADIRNTNALRADWRAIMPADSETLILGNPPFLGPHSRTVEQLNDLQYVWGTKSLGRLDFVTGWYKKAIDYFGTDGEGRFAFVSTNSIAQGDQVPRLFPAIKDAGWRIRFAHQTFTWRSEAPRAAAVHCVIVGFDRNQRPAPSLFESSSPEQDRGRSVRSINAYLVEGPDVIVTSRSTPLSEELNDVVLGSMAKDGGHLTVDPADRAMFLDDPIARRYLRPYIGSRELLHGGERWCIWLENVDPEEWQQSSLIRGRVEAVERFRKAAKADSTVGYASIPHLFTQRAAQSTNFVGIPRVSSENRPYLPCRWFDSDVIASDANYQVRDDDGFQFAILSSKMLFCWQKLIGGRLKSDVRFAVRTVWNNFPLPTLTAADRSSVIAAGREVLAARGQQGDRSLAQLYGARMLEPALLDAHQDLDTVVDELFSPSKVLNSDADRQAVLFKAYERLVG